MNKKSLCQQQKQSQSSLLTTTLWGKKMVIKGPLSNFSRALKANKDKCFQQTSTTWILNDGIDLKKAHGS